MWVVDSARAHTARKKLHRFGILRIYLLSSVRTIPVLAAQLTYQAPVRAHQKCSLGRRALQPD